MDYSYRGGLIRRIVQRDARKCYNEWKTSLYEHFQRVGDITNLDAAKQKPPASLRNSSHWTPCCDRFASPEFQVLTFYFII